MRAAGLPVVGARLTTQRQPCRTTAAVAVSQMGWWPRSDVQLAAPDCRVPGRSISHRGLGISPQPRYNRLDFWGETDLWIHWAQQSSPLEGALD